MFQAETLPQSIADMKTIVLKPRLDQGDVHLIGEKIKPRLFSKFGFKPKSEDIKLLGSEIYYEPYLIIGGKYTLDYCRRHVFRVNINERTTKVFIAGQEFKSEQSTQKKTDKIIKMIGQESAHCEREAYFILDRMKREIPPDRLPISPFDIQRENNVFGSNFKSIYISDEKQIEFLKTKIATRPVDVAEIIKEIFEITDRTIAYYPIYELTFENAKSLKVAKISINGITGEIILNGIQTLAFRTITTFPKGDKYPSSQTNACQIEQPLEGYLSPLEPTENIKTHPKKPDDHSPLVPILEENDILGFPARINGDIFVESDDIIAIVGDVEVPPDTTMYKALVVKGSIKIGDNCIAHGKLKALKDITIGANTLIEGDLFSAGNIIMGPRSVVTGILQATGSIKICGEATVEGLQRSNPEIEVTTGFQFEPNTKNPIASVG
jgi:hypothetical protein